MSTASLLPVTVRARRRFSFRRLAAWLALRVSDRKADSGAGLWLVVGFAVAHAVLWTKILTNLKAAQDAFAPSRQPWERIEPIAELVDNTDAKTDSRVDDFASVDDFAEATLQLALADPAVTTGQILWSEDVLHPELGTRGWLRD